jgi:lysophospholipase L1-like esterase
MTTAVLNANDLATAGGPRRVMQVGTRCQILGTPVASKNSTNTLTRHIIPIAARNIQLGYCNWAVTSVNNTQGGETDGPAQYSRMSAGFLPDFAVANVIAAQFSGKTTPTLDVGGTFISDPIGVYIPAGTAIGVRSSMATATDVNWFGGLTTVSGLTERTEYGTVASPVTDKSLSGSIANGLGASFTPTLILGVPVNPLARSVAIIGDSIPTGTGDTADASTGAIGYIERGLTMAVPASKFTRGSDRLSYWAVRRYCRMSLITKYFTDVIIELGVNDYQLTLSTASQMQTNFMALRDELLSAGIRVWACTVTPVTTGTAGAQTPSTYVAVQQAYNTWLRAGVAGVSGLIDAALIAEGGLNTGVWVQAYFGDGTHPNQAGSIAMSAALNPAMFGY